MEYDVLDVSSAWWDSRMHIQPNTSSKTGSDRKVCFSMWMKAQTPKEKLCFPKKDPPGACGRRAKAPSMSSCTHHLCVGDFSQQLCQVVSTQPLVGVVELQATDGSSHAAAGDHGRRVHGQSVICKRQCINVQSVKQQQQQL